MARQPSERQAQVYRLIEALQIAPQHLKESDAGEYIVTALGDADLGSLKRGRTWSPFRSFFRINADTLDQQLRLTLDPLGIGYCYLIRQNGRYLRSHASGWAQLIGDGEIPWSLDVTQNAGSVGKFITAIALVQLLRDVGVAPTNSIAKYLPDYWTKGPGVEAITFAQLLQHKAGLGFALQGSGPGAFADAKSEIAKGPSSPPPTDEGLYKNVNYAVLRVLFATLTGTIAASFRAPKVNLPYATGFSDDKMWNAFSAAAYFNRVNETVFAPAGCPRVISTARSRGQRLTERRPGRRAGNIGLPTAMLPVRAAGSSASTSFSGYWKPFAAASS